MGFVVLEESLEVDNGIFGSKIFFVVVFGFEVFLNENGVVVEMGCF